MLQTARLRTAGAAVRIGGFDRQSLDLAIQGAGIDIQIGGGFLAIALVAIQGLGNEMALHCLQ